MNVPPFKLTLPQTRTTPLVFASPHSGREYARGFRRASVLRAQALRSSEDAFIDLLFSAAPECGAPLLCAQAPRAYLDLNRGVDELDPALIRGVKPGPVNPRIASGLGVIPRVVSAGRAIYRGKLSPNQAQRRIQEYWHPYHNQMTMLLNESHRMFGESVLIDCHSMPHEALTSMSRDTPHLPEVVLGDRFGASAGGEIVDKIEARFQDAGLRVSRNIPFAGAFTAKYYGHPSRGQHVVQIEIDRALYLDETKITPNANFGHLKTLLDQIIVEITNWESEARSLAAE